MDWISFGNGFVASVFLCVIAVICIYSLCALGRKSALFLAVFAVFSGVATIEAQKTNSVPPNMNSPLLQIQQGGGFSQAGFARLTGFAVEGNPVNPVQTTPDDIARGWRVESVATNAAVSYAMPVDVMLVGSWHVHGARSSFGNNRIDFSGLASGTLAPYAWSFPLGTDNETFSSFWYFVDGRIRPAPKDAAHEICAVGAPMSAVPVSSRFWTAEEPDGSRVLTWENFFLGGDTNSPVNAQIRLYPNGDFTTRSNEVETVCRRVNPDDWDDDGIPNGSDSNPVSCDGAFFGPANVLPEGANTDAYCTVSVVATGPDALITFTGDGPSDYPDPIFVAKSGETNEVVILIGKTYVISSEWPFDVVDASDPETEIWQMRSAAHQTHVRRPVSISASGGNPFTMSVAPSNLGGVFSWNATGCGCSLAGSGDTFGWSCSMSCTCCGSYADGWYSYEGYRLPATSCVCGCWSDGTPKWEPAPGPLLPSVSVSFSKDAVIFENAYENEPGEWVGRNSTRVRLNVVANGGTNGASLAVSPSNLSKLARISGPDLPLAPVAVPAGMQVSYSIVYEGCEASSEADDITVSASVAGNASSGAASDSDGMTSVCLELAAVWEAPENPCTNRHVYGVGEKVLFKVRPQLASVMLSTTKFDALDVDTSEYELFGTNAVVDASGDRIYTCPISANYRPPVKVSLGSVEYLPSVSIVEPKEVVTRGAGWGVNKVDMFYEGNRRCWPSGSVGTATLVTTNYIGPMTVSFRGIAVSEVPCYEEDTITGCFTNVLWRTHTVEAGAGRAHPIGPGNFWFEDSAGLSPTIANWGQGGEFVLKIPVGWHRRGQSDDVFWVLGSDFESWRDSESRALLFKNIYRQRYTIDGAGTCRTEKYGHWISRSRSCRVILDGEVMQRRHPLW